MHKSGARSQLAEAINRHPFPVFLFVSALYFAFAILLVQSRVLGEDEFYTLFQCRLPTVTALWHYLQDSAEGQTPAFMLLTQWLVHRFGDSAFVLRLPGVAGYWLMISGIFWILQRRCGATWAAFGPLLSMSARTAPFAAEARSYALLLGTSTLALFCWLQAKNGRFAVGFAISVCLAAATHYFGILILIPLSAAQLVNDWRHRKIFWPIWFAFTTGVIPLLVALPIIRVSHTLDHFWSPPRLFQLVETFMNTLGPEFGSLLTVGLLAALCLNSSRAGAQPDLAERIAYWGFIALPLAGWLVAYFVTHAYVERYVPQPLIGIAILLALALSARFGPSSRVALSSALVMCLACVFLDAGRISNARRERAGLQDVSQAVDALNSRWLPVAVSSAEVWLRLDHYLGPAHRITYLCDPDLTLQYENQNMMETQLRDHRPMYPASLQMFRPFVARREPFLVLSVIQFQPDWLAQELVHESWDLRLLGRLPMGDLYLAEPPRLPLAPDVLRKPI